MDVVICIDVSIRRQMAPLRTLHSVALTYIYKFKHLKRLYLENGESYFSAGMRSVTFIDVDIFRRMAFLRLL